VHPEAFLRHPFARTRVVRHYLPHLCVPVKLHMFLVHIY